jgi:hypothetical protein
VRGTGTFENGVERPRIEVVLATGIPEDVCRKINLGYMDPAGIDIGRLPPQRSARHPLALTTPVKCSTSSNKEEDRDTLSFGRLSAADDDRTPPLPRLCGRHAHFRLPLPPAGGRHRPDNVFANLTRIWLNGDHYKWRAMRANGVDERFITGAADDREKFAAWAATVPKTLRNPLYHWTHLELKRYFGIDGPPARPADCPGDLRSRRALLQTPAFSTRALLTRMNVKVVCTTDDPVDSLEHHQACRKTRTFTVKVLPAFRPDKATAVEDPAPTTSMWTSCPRFPVFPLMTTMTYWPP